MITRGTKVRWAKDSNNLFLTNYLRKKYPYREMLVIKVTRSTFFGIWITLIGPNGCLLREHWLGPDEPDGFVGRIAQFDSTFFEIID